MGFDLHLILRGLCAVVPDAPIPAEPGANPHEVPGLTVLLLDAKVGEEGGFPICDHVAKIDAEQPQGPNKVVVLTGHSLSLEPLAAGPAKLNASFWELADLNRVYTNFAMKPQLLQDPPGIPNQVVARLHLSAGFVSGFDFSPQMLSFPNQGYSGRFALAVRIRIPIDGATATLTATPFPGSAGAVEEVTITPQSGHTFAEVTLSNLCSPVANVAVFQPDSDFAVYSRLVANLVGPVQVPEVVEAVPVGEVLAQATTPGGSCIPTRA